MNSEITQVIDNLAAKFGIVIDWSQENVMPLIRETLEQLIAYKRISYGMGICISLMFIILGCMYFVVLYKSYLKRKETGKSTLLWDMYYSGMGISTYGGIVTTLIVVATFVASICFLRFIIVLIKLQVAPNVYLLEYFSSLLEGK